MRELDTLRRKDGHGRWQESDKSVSRGCKVRWVSFEGCRATLVSSTRCGKVRDLPRRIYIVCMPSKQSEIE